MEHAQLWEFQMKIAVLGATGRVGRLVTAAFLNDPPSELQIFKQCRKGGTDLGKNWFCWDLTSRSDGLEQLVSERDGIDCLINFAGVTPASESPDFTANARLATACLSEAARLGINQVFLASSAAVYGRPKTNAPLLESATLQPVSDYGIAKLAMENAAVPFQSKLSVTCMRIGNVAGADSVLLNRTPASSQIWQPLDCFEDGNTPLRSYIGARTLAQVLRSLCAASISGQKIPPKLNVASPAPIFMEQLLQAASAVGTKLGWRLVSAPPDALPAVVMSTSVLESFHKFRAQDDLPSEMIHQWRACLGVA